MFKAILCIRDKLGAVIKSRLLDIFQIDGVFKSEV
jgi:hypothetical protein